MADPDDALVEVPVENRYLRRVVTIAKNHPQLVGVFVASVGVLCSIISLIAPAVVIIDIFVDVGAGVLAVTYLKRTVSVTATTTATTTATSTATGYSECPDCGKERVETKTDCPNCGTHVDPHDQ